ncbi:ORF6N domain-containing protein, partial [bacterium]|nr:ORF6N domain-containing protein [bacterium]
ELHYLVKDLERRIDDHDQKIQVIFEAIKQLLKPPELPEKPKRPIGFRGFSLALLKGKRSLIL